jgi:hypothetical protein
MSADKNRHIPNWEIKQDIVDTEREIEIMRREIIGLEMMSDKMSWMRASARKTGVAEREAFVLKLKDILKERGVTS